MNFLKKLLGFASQPDREEANTYKFYARCKRCGEILEGRVKRSA